MGARRCALPLEHVREVMRPVGVERVEPSPPYLLGLAIVRGETVPVVDAAALLGAGPGGIRRWVVLGLGARRVVLGVAAVVGTRTLDEGALAQLPPLLSGASEGVRGLAVLDGALLEVLESSWLLGAAAGAEPGAVAP